MMKFNKDKFMKTEIGSGMEECIAAWDEALDNQLEYPYGTIPHKDAEKKHIGVKRNGKYTR